LPKPIAPQARHLVIVAGHAIWKGPQDGATVNYANSGENIEEWNLKDFQKGQQATYVRHIEIGLDKIKSDTRSVLIFSGGQTAKSAGPLSEAQSYFSLARTRGIIPPDTAILSRITTEEFARDSFENLLFSICRFYEMTGNYPVQISVVSHEFKKKRFVDLHRAAIRYPEAQFIFHGLNPDGDVPNEGERTNALVPFTNDPYGCFDEILLAKKRQRNPFRRQHPYTETCPELRSLLQFCSLDRSIFNGTVPWDI
ncbi:hypothetical protein V1514DRAFT_264261, partial [Lipomyces japonicus]|uniref:uncharacterized protein n=1 Tax=Lipomyces japonicus TaxID=56871 RepID=UPI0034CEFC8E